MSRFYNDFAAIDISEDELAHYGVLGMKWGVRKYQNSDGSYTKAGLKRYQNAKDTADIMKQIKKKHGRYVSIDSDTVMDTRPLYRESKKNLKKAKKALKQDYLADKGKDLYNKRYRITNNAGTKIASVGAAVGTAAVYGYSAGIFKQQQAVTLGAVAGATEMLAAGLKVINFNKDRQLRAYYSHNNTYTEAQNKYDRAMNEQLRKIADA